MDCMGFGMGCCCLQVTFQACNINEARMLYDQLTSLCPIMVSPYWFDECIMHELCAIDINLIMKLSSLHSHSSRLLSSCSHSSHLLSKTRLTDLFISILSLLSVHPVPYTKDFSRISTAGGLSSLLLSMIGLKKKEESRYFRLCN